MVLFLAALLGAWIVFCVGFVAGGTYECYRAGGSKDLRRDVHTALREYDELLSLLSTPPLRETRGTLHRLPVAAVERSPHFTVLNGGDAS